MEGTEQCSANKSCNAVFLQVCFVEKYPGWPHMNQPIQCRINTLWQCELWLFLLLWPFIYPRTFYDKVQISSVNDSAECKRGVICQHIHQARDQKEDLLDSEMTTYY
jgi:hypothetical protein